MTTRNQTLTGAAVVLGCVAACSAPVLFPVLLSMIFTGGAAVGSGAVLRDAPGIASGFALGIAAAALAAGVVLWRRRTARVTAAGACGCEGACAR